jgi:hypothetical protein
MKIGVFVTGQIRNDFDDARYCLDLLENGFPTAEFKYLVWDYEVEQHLTLTYTTVHIWTILPPANIISTRKN